MNSIELIKKLNEQLENQDKKGESFMNENQKFRLNQDVFYISKHDHNNTYRILNARILDIIYSHSESSCKYLLSVLHESKGLGPHREETIVCGYYTKETQKKSNYFFETKKEAIEAVFERAQNNCWY